MHFVVIGGSDAGISAALRARELSSEVDITVLLADAFPNFSICGLPFYVSGETPDWRELAHRKTFAGINILKNSPVREIDATTKRVFYQTEGGPGKELAFDRLLIATGARPVKPQLPGLTLPGVFPLHTMEDSFRVNSHIEETHPRSAGIVGSGYIGLEMADALRHRGLDVTLFGRSETVLPTVDGELGRLVEEELRSHGVVVESGAEVTGIEEQDGMLVVHAGGGRSARGELVLFALGVEPNAELARAAGVVTGRKGAIRVNRRMETNVRDVFAAGDCVETWHRVLDAYSYLPLGTTAHKQGRVAGENAVGGSREFQGSLGTQVVKVFDLAVARTGLRDRDVGEGSAFHPRTVESSQFDHKAYYPGAEKLSIRVTGDTATGRLLGAQILGHWQAEVAKRIDIFATALFHGMRVEALNDLDLSYTPPLGSPWDAVQMASDAWTRAVAE